jgi:sigma-B regulation protein RsbU (phosphoserine phosphatase)
VPYGLGGGVDAAVLLGIGLLDLCDKGVPCALYLSVFRSLLRLNLIKEWNISHQDPFDPICRAIITVIRYMAETHGSTGMFATAFVGGYDPQAQQLHYVVAGHEAPLVLPGCQQKELSIDGPAAGIFANANFQAHSCALGPNGLMLAFSDGLPDPRDPGCTMFGKVRITAILGEKDSQEWTAQALIYRFQAAVQTHMQNAE